MPVALRKARLQDWIDVLLDDWLGYAVPPAADVIRNARFLPDVATEYCSCCGDSVGAGESTESGCASCRDKSAVADRVIRLSSYTDELRTWILALKYERWSAIGEALGKMLGETLQRSLDLDPADAVVVPMPMPWQRRLYRGIEHAGVIADSLARQINAPLVRVLSKTHGPPQVTLSPTDRQRLGGRNLRVRRRFGGWDLTNLHVILVDDVRTTGTTIRRAVKLLQQLDAPPKTITAAVLAVADPTSRRVRSAKTADASSRP